MSTEIKTIKGSCHKCISRDSFKVEHGDAELHLTRFFNGQEKNSNIQLTIQNPIDGISYIHFSKKQCEELAKVLLECFDYNKYPSE